MFEWVLCGLNLFCTSIVIYIYIKYDKMVIAEQDLATKTINGLYNQICLLQATIDNYEKENTKR